MSCNPAANTDPCYVFIIKGLMNFFSNFSGDLALSTQTGGSATAQLTGFGTLICTRFFELIGRFELAKRGTFTRECPPLFASMTLLSCATVGHGPHAWEGGF